jgi:TldD protein
LAARSADRFEVRAQSSFHRACTYDGPGATSVSASRLLGFSVKLQVGSAIGFASGHDLVPGSLARVVEEATRTARAKAARGVVDPPLSGSAKTSALYDPEVRVHPASATDEAVLDLVARTWKSMTEPTLPSPGAPGGPLDSIDAANGSSRAGALRARVLFGWHDERVALLGSNGARMDRSYLLSTLAAQAVRREGARLGEGVAWESGERGLGDYEDRGGPEGLGARAVAFAQESAVAERAPVGRQRVLCDNDLTGLLAHESFGHLTEFDLVAMGWSVLAGRTGERFGEAGVTVVDAPVVPGDPRSGIRLPYDDEGTPGRAVRVLDHGVLSEWLHLRDTAAASEARPTGNGRSLTVRFPPIVRMRNTFIEPGDWSFEDALEALGDGLYLMGARGGAPASDGSFMFTAQRGYRVRKGRIEAPIRGPSISGNIFDFLHSIEGLTRDFRVQSSCFSGCGKWDQGLLPVGMGGPHVLASQVLVGGEQ